jgi:hypothetical protein
MADSNEPILIGTMLRIKKLDGFQISPDGLGFFEPDSMLLEIGPVLVFVQLEFHIISVFYSIYTRQLHKDGIRKGRGPRNRKTIDWSFEKRGDFLEPRIWINMSGKKI